MGAINKCNFKGGGQGGSTENVCEDMRSSGEEPHLILVTEKSKGILLRQEQPWVYSREFTHVK